MSETKEVLFSNRKLVKLIIPLAIEQGLTILVGMCDGMMISSAGEAAISGVSLVDMINAVMLVLFAALATGGAVVTSQYIGARNMEKARHSAGQLVLMSAVLGFGAAALCLVFSNVLMHLFFGSVEADVMQAGLIYLRITALSFPFMALYSAGAAIFRSVGNSKISMKVSVLMNIINVVGNAVCIFGLKMGVAGVAVPTLISRAVAAVIILALVSDQKQELYLTKDSILRYQGTMVRNILHIGIPSALENSFFQFGRLLIASMIAVFGTTQTSANAVANTVDGVGIIFGQAMGLAMVTVIGQCIGAQDTDQASYNLKKLLGWTYLLQGSSNVLIILLVKPIIGLYSSLSPETQQLAYTLIMIHSTCAIFLWPLSFVVPNALRAANDVKFTMWVSVASMISFRIGGSWLLSTYFGWGVVGAWIAMISDWIFRISFFVPRLISGKWKTKYKAS